MANLRHSNGEVRLSQSAMEAFFACPARLKYMSEWSSKEPARALVDGLAAHAILAGDEVPDASPMAVGYAESLWDLAASNNIELWAQEFEQTFLLEEGIWYKRIIDGIGTYQGMPVLIDWKTSGKGPWPRFRGEGRQYIVPKSMSFQAVSYLIPTSDQADLDRFGLAAWPDTILFVVSDADGHGDIVAYSKDAAMEENFRQAARMCADAIRNDCFPHVRGGVCGLPGTTWACNFVDLCYQIPGWEDRYERIGR